MPARSDRPPKYSHHKARGLAYVRDRGRFRYLGKFNSPESKEAYRRFLIEWEARRAGTESPLPEPGTELTVLELCAAYLDFAQSYYVKNGRPTGEMWTVHRSIRVVKELYGQTTATDFGPLKLRKIQKYMVGSLTVGNKGKSTRYSRKTINSTCAGIKRMFKWGASLELVPVAVHQALLTVPGLSEGRTAARESKPIQPVGDEVVDATLPHLPTVVADMVRFQRLTGCRPGEVCQLRPADVDRSGEVWEYRPQFHKTEHHGRERIIYVGPKAQAVLMSYLLRDAEAHCFSPAESEQKRRVEQRTRRKTRVQPSQWDRRKKHPKRQPRTAYTKDSYRRAVAQAIEKANAQRVKEADLAGEEPPAPLPHWHPNQLRHAAATEIRRRFGLEAAQVILGHAKADVTQVYAERDAALAVEVIKRIG